MATVGQVLTTPESGWKRLDDRDSYISYSSGWASQSYSGYYLNTAMYTQTTGSSLSFTFVGTKLRVLANTYSNRDSSITITIDGIAETFSEYTTGDVFPALVYEKTNLSSGEHKVVIQKTQSGSGVVHFDAIDIDDTGSLIRSIGNQITAPDSGWQRYDDRNNLISYATGAVQESQSGSYSATWTRFPSTVSGTDVIKFKFKGTKIRVISYPSTDRANDAKISIDGVVEKMPAMNGATQAQTLIYEKTGLTNAVHSVVLTAGTNGTYANLLLDAIDIDDTGVLYVGVGDQLTSPESGWQRFDDNTAYFWYAGNWTVSTTNSTAYGSSTHTSNSTDSAISFRFNGSKLRIISTVGNNRSNNIKIAIDGVEERFSAYSSGADTPMVISYQKTSLANGVHSVVITVPNDGGYFVFDAIDIDDIGTMLTLEGWKRIEQTDSRVGYRSGTWTVTASSSQSGGSWAYSNTYGAYYFFTFYGTKMRLIGNKQSNGETNSRVVVDGVTYTSNQYNATTLTNQVVFEITGLEPKNHVVSVTKMTNNTTTYTMIDAIEIDEVGYLSTSVGLQYTTPESGWQRIDSGDPRFSYDAVTNWTLFNVATGTYGGTQNYSNIQGSKMTFKFTGTKLRVYDYNHPNRSQLSTITIDGVSETYNGAPFSDSKTAIAQTMIYEKTGLPYGTHTVTIEKTESGTTTYLVFDSIDIDADGKLETFDGQLLAPETGWQRIDQNNTMIGYMGAGWSLNVTGTGIYGGSNSYTSIAGNYLVFYFYGTKLRIIDTLYPNRDSNVKVTVDGTPYYYNASSSRLQFQTVLFEKTGLNLGIHRVTLEKVSSDTTLLCLDAIDIDSDGYMMYKPFTLLTAAESGWKRVDSTDTSFGYSATSNWTSVTGAANYGGSAYGAKLGNAVAVFRFKGTKFRIIGIPSPLYTDKVKVTIDGDIVEYFTAFGENINQKLLYEKTGLENKEHYVFIKTQISNKSIATYDYFLDAIDIDSTGTAVPLTTDHVLLTTPESGWKRIDDAAPEFGYINLSKARIAYTGAYATTLTYGEQNTVSDREIRFKFTGTKLRIISQTYTPDGRGFNSITIDGVPYSYSDVENSLRNMVKVFEITGLSDSTHTVTINQKMDDEHLVIDAIDIDANATLLPTVRSVLTTPEAGWRRYEDNNPAIDYRGTWAINTVNASCSGGNISTTTVVGSSASFRFKGTKLRIIDAVNTNRDRNIKITIDGVDYFYDSYNYVLLYQNIVFNIEGLPDTIHSVTITKITNDTSYLCIDAIDIDATGRLYHPLEVESFDQLTTIGNRIRVNYAITAANSVGKFNGLGQETMAFLPSIPTTTTASGDFYLIYVDYERTSYRKKLLADRVIQGGIAVDTLNNVGFVTGAYLEDNNRPLVRLPTGGHLATVGDSEWDDYIVKSTLGGTIISGDNRIWNWSGQWSHTNGFHTNSNNRMYRGNTSVSAIGANTTAVTTLAIAGFRPIFVTEGTSDFSSLSGSITVPSRDKTQIQSHIKVNNPLVPYNGIDYWLDLNSANSQYLQMKNGLILDNSFTIDFWTYVKSYTSWARFLNVSSASASATNYLGITQSVLTGKFYVGATTGTTQIFALTTADAVPLNTWVHIALTYDYTAGTITLYKNGEVWISGTSATKLPQGITRELSWIGKSFSTADAYLNAKLNEYRIWNVAMSKEKIGNMMYRKADGYEPNLVHLWNFELNNFYEIDPNIQKVIANAVPNNTNDLLYFGGTLESSGIGAKDMLSKAFVLERNDLTSKMFVNPSGQMTVKTDVVATYFSHIISGIAVKNTDNLMSSISVRPWGSMLMKIDVIPPPRTTVNLTSVKDAFVRSGVPRLNYGSSQDMVFGHNSELNESYRSLIGFDISSIPIGQRIESAKLKLFFDYENVDELELELCEVNESWTELGVTWINQPSITNILRTFKVGLTRGYVELDLLDKVNEWYAGTNANNGFIIRSKDEAIPLFYRFYTRENSRSKPFLEVRYYDPSPKSIDIAELAGTITARASKDRDFISKINVVTRYREESINSYMHIRNLNWMIESSIAISRPDMTSRIAVRRSKTVDFPNMISVRKTSSNEFISKLFVGNPDIRSKIRVRRSDMSILMNDITVRRNDKNDVSSKIGVSRPQLLSSIRIEYSNSLPSTITVLVNQSKALNSKISVSRSDIKDLISNISIMSFELLPSHIQVLSGYLRSTIIIPYTAHKDLVTRVLIVKVYATDLVSKLSVGSGEANAAYVFIM